MMFHRPINETDAPKFQRDVRSAVVQMAAHTRQVLTTVVRRGASGNLLHGWAHEATAGPDLVVITDDGIPVPDERNVLVSHILKRTTIYPGDARVREVCIAGKVDHAVDVGQSVKRQWLQYDATHFQTATPSALQHGSPVPTVDIRLAHDGTSM